MADEFEERCKELRIDRKEKKTLEAHYMGSESKWRQRYQISQSRGRSNDINGKRNNERGQL